MSDVTRAPDFRPGEIQHAMCGNCGGVVRVHVPDFSSREIRLWWPGPLALIIWLALIWKFGYFLASPKVEMAASSPIEASFVEMPEAAQNLPDMRPGVQSKTLPRQSKSRIRHRPDPLPEPEPSPRTDMAAVKPAPPADAPLEPDSAPPADLMAYVNAARERRRAAEVSAGLENAQATANERGPSADETRMANVMRNLQPQGTNGVFQIISMSVRTAKFSFRGWTKDFNNGRREVIEVDAGPGGNVERATVRSMIALIRRYYKGDFNWESQRLGRVIVMSARMEDNAELEDFLMREFFGTGA
ncbi:MAG: hypothetical protein U0938_14430 [Thiobacillus sp.]|nr:hypothetical protein [Thiobacillus sp.]